LPHGESHFIYLSIPFADYHSYDNGMDFGYHNKYSKRLLHEDQRSPLAVFYNLVNEEQLLKLFPTHPPYHRFREFIAPHADRFKILKTILEELAINHQVVSIAGNRHFLVFPDMQKQTKWPDIENLLCGPELLRYSLLKNNMLRDREAILLVAHYDRVAHSPGANDNSAAVFELINAALILQREDIRHWFMIFTDKEELDEGEGLCTQGAYTLAKGLKDAKFGSPKVFIFDACGSGDTLIISTVADLLTKNDERAGSSRIRHAVQQLRQRALETARTMHLECCMIMPTPFSDDAGFFRANLAAQTITMLPSTEATACASLFRNKPDIIALLISGDKSILPETWRRLNTSNDAFSYLTPQYFPTVVRFVCALCGA
jgi:hypothetical protein